MTLAYQVGNKVPSNKAAAAAYYDQLIQIYIHTFQVQKVTSTRSDE